MDSNGKDVKDDQTNLIPLKLPLSGGGDGSSSPVIGRIKAPPVCLVEALKVQSLTSNQLSKMCFTPLDAAAAGGSTPSVSLVPVPSSVSTVVSSSSSTTSNGSLASHNDSSVLPPSDDSGVEGVPTPPRSFPSKISPSTPPPPKSVMQLKETIRATSRVGRENQRWATDSQTNQVYRLTTGTVPIMNDGRILFVSSSRKNEWILPKGGWESDESMEDSAIRETFEEAGVLGVLGPKLSFVDYETRKAKKRRLEREELLRKQMEKIGVEKTASSGVQAQLNPTSTASSEAEPNLMSLAYVPPEGGIPSGSLSNTNQKTISTSDGTLSPRPQGPLSSELIASIGYSNNHHLTDDSASVASISSDVSTSCSHVRMCLFPLYVSEVKGEWPESGRLRKVLDIDAGIKMMESRPEFRVVLEEVKQKGLHLVSSSTERKGLYPGEEKDSIAAVSEMSDDR